MAKEALTSVNSSSTRYFLSPCRFQCALFALISAQNTRVLAVHSWLPKSTLIPLREWRLFRGRWEQPRWSIEISPTRFPSSFFSTFKSVSAWAAFVKSQKPNFPGRRAIDDNAEIPHSSFWFRRSSPRQIRPAPSLHPQPPPKTRGFCFDRFDSLGSTRPGPTEADHSIHPRPANARRQNSWKITRIALIRFDSFEFASPGLTEAGHSIRPCPPSAKLQNSARNTRIALIAWTQNLSGLRFEAPASMRFALRGVSCSPRRSAFRFPVSISRAVPHKGLTLGSSLTF